MLQLMDLPPEIRQIIFIDSSKKARGTLQVLKLHLLARCDNPRHTEERPPGRALCLLYVLPQSRQTGVLRAEYFERIICACGTKENKVLEENKVLVGHSAATLLTISR